MIKTLFFDLFWTLLSPTIEGDVTEYSLLNISEWEYIRISEDKRVSTPRYLGDVKDELQMIRDITSLLDENLSPKPDELCQKILNLRLERIRKGTIHVNPKIINTLKSLKEKGYKICIVSNADMMDIHYWNEGPLKDIVDEAVFSCDIHALKPDEKIYTYALEKMKALPSESVFIGDGGSEEIEGAKRVGMTTILTEHFSVKSKERREKILKSADYCISKFEDLLNIL